MQARLFCLTVLKSLGFHGSQLCLQAVARTCRSERNKMETRNCENIVALQSSPRGFSTPKAPIFLYGVFLKWWVSPTTRGFPTKNDHFGVFWGTTISGNTRISSSLFSLLFIGATSSLWQLLWTRQLLWQLASNFQTFVIVKVCLLFICQEIPTSIVTSKKKNCSSFSKQWYHNKNAEEIKNLAKSWPRTPHCQSKFNKKSHQTSGHHCLCEYTWAACTTSTSLAQHSR